MLDIRCISIYDQCHMKCFFCLLQTLFLISIAHAQKTLIDATFDGIENDSNNAFSIITNAPSDSSGGSWNQETGFVNRGSANNSTAGAVSVTPVDIPSFGISPIILSVDVDSLTGTVGANGIFIGFQAGDGGADEGGDLWNNLAPAFGVVIDGGNRLGARAIAPGGNRFTGTFQDGPAFGTSTLAALNDGFTVTLILSNTRWQFVITGLETTGGTAITGGSGTWADVPFDYEDFTNQMYVAFTTQGNSGGSIDIARVTVAIDTDSDGNGLPDTYEIANGTDENDPSDAALDNDLNGGPDGLTNLQEFQSGTDPQDSDTDDDNISDGDELNGTINPWTNGLLSTPPGAPTNPLLADTDGDGVNDDVEIANGTDPNNLATNIEPVFAFIDTDGDSFSDTAEVAFGSDPNDASDIPNHSSSPEKPNVVIIYADDMGLAEVSAYGDIFGAISPAVTPNMDALAAAGTLFTQAHSSNGVCTPSRYSLLTGKYNWREFNNISGHYGFISSIAELPRASDVTIAEFLKGQSYDTAAFGKWHLGGRWYAPNSDSRVTNNPTDPASVDWARPVEGHAVAHGFDIFRGLATSINFGPYVYLENDRNQIFDQTLNDGEGGYRDATNSDTFVRLTQAQLNSSIVQGAERDSRASLGDPTYRQVDAGPFMITQVEEFIAEQANNLNPFFAYVSLYSPHEPWALTPSFVGDDVARGFFYGDWMREVDNRIGRVINAIDSAGLRDNTIIILTSDNGTENAAMTQSLNFDTDPNGPLRGNKRDAWEGGTRVPFIVRWPGQAAAGLVVTDPIWQGDIFATVAAYLNVEIPNETAPDGESFLNLIRGQQKPSRGRESIIVSSLRGHLGLKTDDGWKLIDATGGGGSSTSWDSANIRISDPVGVDRGVPKQLFNLSVDIGENNNLIADLTGETDIRNELTAITGSDLLAGLDALRVNSSTEVFPRIPDNDGDSLPNSFEMQFGLDPNSPIDAEQDLDQDGFTNREEYLAGTDPSDTTDRFRVRTLQDSPTELVVSWPSIEGRTYTVLWSTDMQTWATHSVVVAEGEDQPVTINKAAIDVLDGVIGNLGELFVKIRIEEP